MKVPASGPILRAYDDHPPIDVTAMKNPARSTPLIELLPLAVKLGVIDSWEVKEAHLVFRIGSEELYVSPVAAGSFLAALLDGDDAPVIAARRRQLIRVASN